MWLLLERYTCATLVRNSVEGIMCITSALDLPGGMAGLICPFWEWPAQNELLPFYVTQTNESCFFNISKTGNVMLVLPL